MKRMKWLVPIAALSLIVAACGDDDAGAEVTIFGAFTSIEGDSVNAVIDDMIEPDANYTAFYEGSESFEEQIKIRVEGGNPPDIALYPQPGSVVPWFHACGTRGNVRLVSHLSR